MKHWGVAFSGNSFANLSYFAKENDPPSYFFEFYIRLRHFLTEGMPPRGKPSRAQFTKEGCL